MAGAAYAAIPRCVVPLDELTGFDIDLLVERMSSLLATYRDTLRSDRRRLVDHFALTDVADKVVGVGSVGTRTWILLHESGVEGDALLLQAKQAEASALDGYAGETEYRNQGERARRGTASGASLE